MGRSAVTTTMLILWCLLPSNTASGEHINEVIQLLNNYLDESNQPTEIIAMLCWSLENNVELHRQLHVPLAISAVSEQLKEPPLEYDDPRRQNILWILDIGCPQAEYFLRQSSERKMFGSPYRWLLLDLYKMSFNMGVVEARPHAAFAELNILPDSDVVVAERQYGGQYELYYVYKTSTKGPVIVEQHSNWSIDGGMEDLRKCRITSRRRQNLHGAVIYPYITITNNNSISQLDTFRDKHIDSVSRLPYRLIKHMMEAINVTGTFTIVSTWGSPINNSEEWSGMIGALQRGDGDVGSGIYITEERTRAIDYISMVMPSTSRFVFRAPPLSFMRNIFYMPFSDTVWISSIVLIAILAVGLLIAVHWEWVVDKEEDVVGLSPRLRASWSEMVLLSFGAIGQQGHAAEPHRVSGRMVVFVFFASIMFLYTSYSANIVALLQSTSFAIKTVRDLTESRIQCGVHDHLNNRYHFRTAKAKTQSDFYNKKIVPRGKKPHFMTLEEGVARMRQGLFAFHMETGVGYKLVEDTFLEEEKCGLVEVDFLSFSQAWMPMKKRSPYKEIFKVNMFRIRESGIQSRGVQRYYTKKPQCSGGAILFVSVGFTECYIVMLVLAVGAALAVGVFIVEHIVYHYTKKHANLNW